MAVIRGATAASMLPDAIVLDLGDLARQGKAMMERAQAEADAVLAQARIERDRLIAGASEQGFEEGRAAGFAQGLEEGRRAGHADAIASSRTQATGVVQAWETALQSFESARAAMVDAAQEDTVRFAVAFAERLTRRAVELDPRAITPILTEAIGLVLAGSTISVRIAPVDAAVAREVIGPIMQRLGHSTDADVQEDPTLRHGSCIVRTQAGHIDASIDTMITRMLEQLLPSRSTSGPEGGAAARTRSVEPASTEPEAPDDSSSESGGTTPDDPATPGEADR